MTQEEYIAILFDDIGFHGPYRRAWLAENYDGRRYADELSVYERSGLIDRLKAMKASDSREADVWAMGWKQGQRDGEDEDDEGDR